MIVIIILLILATVILLIQLNYKNHCINDLETRISRMRKLQVSEVLDLLYMLRDIQNDYSEKATKDTMMRNAINDNIEKYSEQKRYLTERGFDELIKEAGKKYIENEYKKELSNSDQTETR